MAAPVKKSPSVQPKHRLDRIIQRLGKVYPDAKLDLDFANALELLIALMLAAKARDDLVRQITPDLFKKYRTAEDYAKASLPELEQNIGKINFYRNKARSIHNAVRN
jgi:endonuclease III